MEKNPKGATLLLTKKEITLACRPSGHSIYGMKWAAITSLFAPSCSAQAVIV